MTRNEAILWTKKLASGIHSQEELNVFLDYMRNASEEQREEVLTAYHSKMRRRTCLFITGRCRVYGQAKIFKAICGAGYDFSSPERMFMTPWWKTRVAVACISSLTLSIYWLFFDRHTHSLDVASSESESIWAMPERNKAMPRFGRWQKRSMLDAAVQGNVPGQAG